MNPIKEVTCVDKHGNAREMIVSNIVFRPSVYGIIIQDGKILMSAYKDGGYDFPGGGVEIHESIKDALIRECKEETGLDVRVGDIVECQSMFYSPMNIDVGWNAIAMFFECSVIGGKLSAEYLEPREKKYMKQARWIPIKDIDNIVFNNSHPDNEGIINKALRHSC